MTALTGPRTLHPRQVAVWRVGWGAGAAVVVAVAAVADLVARAGGGASPPWPPGLPAVALAAVAAPLVWWWPTAAFARWRYELAPTTLELRRGVVLHVHTAVPYFRVQHIDITRSPIERWLGLSQLVVRTAAASTDFSIPGIAAEEAESLRDVILDRTGGGDAV